MKERLLAIKSIRIDEKVYPRERYNWMIGYNYATAMKSGATFPPIKVALFRGHNILVDGKHRLEAMKLNGEKHIQAIVLEGLTRDRIYIEAVKANVGHGYQLSPFEKAKIVQRLGEMKMSQAEISSIICIPVAKLSEFVAKRMVNTLTGAEIVKAPLRHLAKGSSETPIDMRATELEEAQRPLTTMSQFQLVDQLISILDEPELVKRDKKFLEKLVELKEKVEAFLKSL